MASTVLALSRLERKSQLANGLSAAPLLNCLLLNAAGRARGPVTMGARVLFVALKLACCCAMESCLRTEKKAAAMLQRIPSLAFPHRRWTEIADRRANGSSRSHPERLLA